jgi:hypothetical protein
MQEGTTITRSTQRQGARAARFSIGGAIALGGTINLFVLGVVLRNRPALNSDFLAFWSDARFAATQKIAGIYDADTLQAYQQTLYPGFHSFYPFTYPPTFLLVCRWLANFSFAGAETIWTIAGLVAMMLAGWWFFGRGQRLAVVAMLASPACLLNAMAGQTAFFTTALLLAGLAALQRQPVLAGIAFGLLTLKPQLGVLVPFALLARGEWRTMAVAAVTAVALVGASCIVLPPVLWREWADSLPLYQLQYFTSRSLNLNTIITIAGNLVVLGAAPAAACAVQLGAGLVVAVAIFCAFRVALPGLAMAALLCGGFLAVPHAYAYDTITLTAAMALLARQVQHPSAALLALGLVVYLSPLLLLTPRYHWFFYALPETLLFIAIIVLALGSSKRALFADEPEFHHARP